MCGMVWCVVWYGAVCAVWCLRHLMACGAVSGVDCDIVQCVLS